MVELIFALLMTQSVLTREPVIVCQYLVPAIVVNVVDGAVLEIRAPSLDGNHWHGIVKLRDVDAPSLVKPECEQEKIKGRTAKAVLEKLIPGDRQVLLCAPFAIDKGVVEANVATMQGINLGRLLLEQGVVRPRNKEKTSWCLKEQA